MQLAFETLVQEGLAGQLRPADALTEMTYRIYRNRPGMSQKHVNRRVVVLSQAQAAGPQGVLLGHEEVGQFLLELLVVDGERVGELVYDCPVQPLDYVLEPVGQGYRLTRPAQHSQQQTSRAA